jgi:DHA1 family inner membrane transport protein
MNAAPHYVPAHFTTAQTCCLLMIAVISGIVPGLQPLLLGRLAAEGKISLAQIGHAATAEAIGMTIAAALAGAFLKPERLRLIILSAAAIAVVANLAVTQLAGEAILIARLLNGLASGIMLWVFVGALARVAGPARLVAINVTVMGVVMFALSTLFSAYLFPVGGSTAGYAAMAALGAVIAGTALVIPNRYEPLADAGGIAIPSARGFAGLAVVMFNLAAIMAVWVYIVPVGRQLGLTEETTSLAVSFSLGGQILAGLCCAILATRVAAVPSLLFNFIGSLIGLALLALGGSLTTFFAGTVLIAIFWTVATPFHMPYLIQIDPTRRAAMQMLTAQLVGVGAGPLLASLAVSNAGVSGAIVTASALFVAASLILLTTVAGRKASAQYAGAELNA